jgi:Spy/CpxP family protein refolding chaperone
MKTLFRLSLMLAVASLLSFNQVEAQRGHSHGPGPGQGYGPDSCHIQMMVNDLAEELSLTTDQEQKILELHYAHIEKVKSFRDEYKNDCVAGKAAHEADRKELDDEVRKVLNNDQAVKFEQFILERNEHHGPGHHGR